MYSASDFGFTPAAWRNTPTSQEGSRETKKVAEMTDNELLDYEDAEHIATQDCKVVGAVDAAAVHRDNCLEAKAELRRRGVWE